MTKPKVAILGLGIMGGGMASRLLDEQFSIAVFNRSLEKAAALGQRGAKVCASPGEAAAGADVVISMLADDEGSCDVWLSEEGALGGVHRGATLIESSTVSPRWVRQLASAAASRGCDLLDAPVTGSKPQAASGQLLFLVGGAEAALERARPVLAALSRDIVHLGPVGSGALVKLINNFVCGVQVVAIAEALSLIERTHLNVEKALSVLTEGAPGSPLVKVLSKRMTSRDFTPNFILKLMEKDLKYAMDEARTHALTLSTATAAFHVMRKADEAGLGDKDFSAVIELLRQ